MKRRQAKDIGDVVEVASRIVRREGIRRAQGGTKQIGHRVVVFSPVQAMQRNPPWVRGRGTLNGTSRSKSGGTDYGAPAAGSTRTADDRGRA